MLRFGSQLDMAGILAGSEDADRAVGYLCKYLTKSAADTYDGTRLTAARARHLDRLYEETRWLPCSPTCANWLRYGVQPQDAHGRMSPGHCPSKAHDRDTLGLSGRRVLVSRYWTGKTLTGHRANRAEIVRAVLEEAGYDAPDVDRYASTVERDDGVPRYIWTPVDTDLPTYRRILAESIAQRRRWRTQYERAKQRVGPCSAIDRVGRSESRLEVATDGY